MDDEIKKAQALLPEFATFAVFRDRLYAAHPSRPVMVYESGRGWRPVKWGDGVAKLNDPTPSGIGTLIRSFNNLMRMVRN